MIAKNYWRLPENATMRDVLLAVRADEANHREYVKKFLSEIIHILIFLGSIMYWPMSDLMHQILSQFN